MEKAYKLEFTAEENEGLYVTSCGLSKTQPHHHFGPAIKPHHMIHYILSGKGIFRLKGKEYKLGEGSGFLITPDELSYYEADEDDPWTYVWVGFGGKQAASIVEQLSLSADQPIFTNNDSDKIYSIVHDMMEHNTFRIGDFLERNGQLHLFLAVVAGSQTAEKGESESANNYVQKAISFIRGNYYNPIKVTDVADYVCINRSYLYTLFEKTLGVSPQQYLSSYRISKACDLLKVTDLPIESIAISSGYNDPLVFTKAFRLDKGMSPSSYRKAHKHESLTGGKEHLKQVEKYLEGKTK